MAIPEACGLWIEQRIQEELETKGETGVSFRAISRTIGAEIEKYFETTVKPETIRKMASRMNSGTNVAPQVNGSNDSGNEDNKENKKGLTAKGEPRKRAPGAGRPKEKKVSSEPTDQPTTVPEWERRPVQYTGIYSDAELFAGMAISQLERISNDDPNAMKALDKVSDWIAKRKRDL